MDRRSKWIGLALLLFACLLFVGCGPQPAPTPTPGVTPAAGPFMTWVQNFLAGKPLAGLLPNLTGNPTMMIILVLGGILVLTKLVGVDLSFVVPFITKGATWLFAGKSKVPVASAATEKLVTVLQDIQSVLRVSAQNQAQITEVLNRVVPEATVTSAASAGAGPMVTVAPAAK